MPVSLDNLQKRIDSLAERIYPDGPDKHPFGAIYSDMLKYKEVYPNLADLYRNAWEDGLRRQICAFNTSALKPTQKPYFEELKLSRMRAPALNIRVKFGQIRMAPNFQSPNVNQQAVVGFPTDKVPGKQVQVVSGEIQEGTISNGVIPVEIFWFAGDARRDACWVSINNRGYAAHCEGGKAPLRLWPRMPTPDESNRLDEFEHSKETPGGLGPFTSRKGMVTPRRLPSDEMPVTNGPESWEVTRVIKVPNGFR